MFALVVLFEHSGIRARDVFFQSLGEKCHFRNLFEHGCVVNRFRPVFPEGEHAVALHKDGGHFQGVDFFRREFFGNHKPRVPFVLSFDFRLRERSRAGDVAVKIIGVRGAVKRNRPPRLCKRGGKRRVRVHDSAERGKCPVKLQMGGRIGRGAQRPFDDVAFKIDDDHIFRPHFLVRNARGFDDEKPLLSVDFAHVPPGVQHEPVRFEL